MPPHRFLVVLAITGGLCAPRDAAAFCDLSGPYLGTGAQLPLGCPFHVYRIMEPLMPTPFRPAITVIRAGSYVDATGPITSSTVDLSVERTFVDCELRPTSTMRTTGMYQHYAIQPFSVKVGELIGFGSGWFGGIEIVPAGTCAAPIEPQLMCTEMPPCDFFPIDDIDSGGCAAGGGGGLAIGLALLGLRAARRRRR